MTKEEFKKKLSSDEALSNAFEADPVKVIQENNVEVTEEDLEYITAGLKCKSVAVKLNIGWCNSSGQGPKMPISPKEDF